MEHARDKMGYNTATHLASVMSMNPGVAQLSGNSDRMFGALVVIV